MTDPGAALLGFMRMRRRALELSAQLPSNGPKPLEQLYAAFRANEYAARLDDLPATSSARGALTRAPG